MKRPRRSKVSPEQLRIVLSAIADIEGWDDQHPSIATHQDGSSWIVVDGKPMPSCELISAVIRHSR